MAAEERLLCSKRLNLALICFLGSAIAYMLRSNLSFAIVCMTGDDQNKTTTKTASCGQQQQNSTGILSDRTTQITPGSEILFNKEFIWSKSTQGTILSAFFWGYLTSQVLGGYLSSLIGAKRIIFGAIFLSSLLTIISPISARFHVIAFIVTRVLLGFAQGSLFPAMHSLWSNWAPPLERGILTGISYGGSQIGNVLVMPISGLLCKYGFDGGWPSIFYLLGVFGMAWSALWMVCTAETPQTHRSISEGEKRYIVESLGTSTTEDTHKVKTNKKIPFVKMLTSLPLWAIFIGHFAGDWGAYTMALGLPSFMNDVLGLNLTSMGMISAIPYILYFAVINLGGIGADQFQNRRILSTLNTRRLAMILALCGQALFLLLIGYSECGQVVLVIILVTLSIGISGLQYSGFVVNYLDICPQYAGVALGIGNTLTCMAGVISPIIMGVLTPTSSKEEWLNVFYVTAAILILGSIVFCVFAKAEVQPWAKDPFDTKAKQNLPTQLEQPLLLADEDVVKAKNDAG